MIHFTLFCLKTITSHNFLMFCAAIRKKLAWSDLQNIVWGFELFFIDIWPAETDSRIRGQKCLHKCEKSWKEQLKIIMSRKREIDYFWLFFAPLNSSEIYNAMFNHDLGKFNQEIFLYCLIRSWQDLTKMYQEFFSYQDLGKIIHVLSRLSRSCMSWQGVSNFVSLGGD